MGKSEEKIMAELIQFFADFGEKMHEIIFKMPLKGEHLSLSQLKVTCFLGKKDGFKMKEITKEIGIASSSATELIDKLIKENLVERYRDKEDRRVVRVKLTEKAKSYVYEAKERKRKFWANMMKNFETEELLVLHKYSGRFYEIISKMVDEGIYY